MSECRLPGCDREVGTQDRDDYRKRSFCGVQHEVKWDHVKDDLPAVPEVR